MASNSLQNLKRTLNVLNKSSKYAKYSVSVRKHSLWTQDSVVKSPYKTLQLPNCNTLYDYVWENLEKWPERTISVCAITGRGYTYEQAFMLSNAFAANLRTKFKIQDGDCVVVMLPNIPDFPLVAMGIIEAGGLISTVNPIYTAHELQRQLCMSEAKVIVTIPQNVNKVKDALKLAEIDIPIIVVRTNGDSLPEGTVAFNELSEDIHVDKSCLKKVIRTKNDVCFLPYSSGTTGLPKGVELTHTNIIANCEQVNDPMIRCYEDTTDSHQDAVLAVLPFFHIYGATVLMFHMIANGVKLVTMPQLKPETFAKALVKYKTNVIFVAPPLVNMMSTHPAMSQKTFQYLDVVMNGAAPLASSDADRFFAKINRKIRFGQGYGLTETSPAIAMSPRGFENYSSVGYPLSSTEIKVVDSDMKTLGPNMRGELLVKGPQVMRGYRNNAAATAEVFTSDGWFRTGDLAVVSNDGEVTIADRLKDLIKVCGITDRQYTYKQLHRQSQILGAKLRKSFQIKDGDTVALMLPNIPEFPVTVLGVLAAGGVVSTLNPVYTPHELQRLLPISDPKVIFVVNETASVVKEALAALKRNIPVISITLNNHLPPGTVRFTELVDDDNIDLSVLNDVRRTADDVAFLLYSSGTTGLPKGMELTHKNQVANWMQQSTEQRLYTDTTETHQDATLAILPIFHMYGLSIVTMHKLSVGLKVVTMPRFHPEIAVDVLDRHKFDLMYLAPPLVLFLGSHPQITSKHLERLRCVTSGAAPLPHADIQKLIARVTQRDFHFGQGYGLSETGPLATIAHIGFNDYKSVGFALPSVQLRVVNGDLKNLGPNEAGELLIKGPNVMKGYKSNPVANKDVFVDGGWLRTGDLARIGENGAVYILDRLKELIKVSGFQVPPAELEAVIKEHPAVFDAAVIGVKDPKTGERPKTFIQLNTGYERDSEDIIKFVNERVAPYKKIKDVEYLDEIPKNASGKILRRVLAEKCD